MPDDTDPTRRPASGPRRYVPVPGVVDLDALHADAGPDEAPDAPSPFQEPAPASPFVMPDPALEPLDVPDPPAPEAPPLQEPPPAPSAPDAASNPGERAAEDAQADAVESPALESPVPESVPAESPTPPSEPTGAADGPSLRPPPDVVATAKEATRSRGRQLVALVVTYGKRHLPPTPEKAPAVDAGPPRLVGRLGQIIPYLQAIPWLLGAVFVASFWLMDAEIVLFGRASTVGELLQVLSVSGLIGFGTNWLAITMLFQPREKRAIVPQGLIPAQRERVVYRLSDAISRELINADIIKQKIQESGVIRRYRDLALGVVRGVVEDPAFRADLKGLAAEYAQETLGSEAVRRELASIAVQKVEEQAGQGLGGVALRLYRTFAEADFQRRVDKALVELPQAVTPLLDRIDAALDAVPARVEARADEIEETATRAVLSFVEGLDVRSMIMEKASGFDESQLESLLKSTSNEQLNYIKYLGGILGVFGGLVIWQPVGSLVVFAVAGLALWGIDEALVRARRARS